MLYTGIVQIKTVEAILRLMEEGTVTKASERLYISQQGLSRQVKAAEDELGARLFERSKAGVRPTALLTMLEPHLARIRDEYALIRRLVDDHERARDRRVLTIGFAIGVSNCLDTGFLFDYRKESRDVGIRMEEWSQAVCVRKLLGGELDLAFVVNPLERSELRCLPLAEDYMFAAVHKDHPLGAETGPVDFSVLDGEPVITGSPDNALRELFDRYCLLSGIAPRVVVASSYSLTVLNAMKENAGIATVTTAMARRVTNPDIVIRRLLTPEPGILYLAAAKDAPEDRARDSLERFIRRYFAATALPRFKED